MYICCKGTESCHENTCVRSLTALLRNSACKLIAMKFYSQMYCIYVILPKLYNYPTHCSFISSFFFCWITTWPVRELHSTHEKPHKCCFTHVSTNFMLNFNLNVVFFVKNICTLIILFLFKSNDLTFLYSSLLLCEVPLLHPSFSTKYWHPNVKPTIQQYFPN